MGDAAVSVGPRGPRGGLWSPGDNEAREAAELNRVALAFGCLSVLLISGGLGLWYGKPALSRNYAITVWAGAGMMALLGLGAVALPYYRRWHVGSQQAQRRADWAIARQAIDTAAGNQPFNSTIMDLLTQAITKARAHPSGSFLPELFQYISGTDRDMTKGICVDSKKSERVAAALLLSQPEQTHIMFLVGLCIGGSELTPENGISVYHTRIQGIGEILGAYAPQNLNWPEFLSRLSKNKGSEELRHFHLGLIRSLPQLAAQIHDSNQNSRG